MTRRVIFWMVLACFFGCYSEPRVPIARVQLLEPETYKEVERCWFCGMPTKDCACKPSPREAYYKRLGRLVLVREPSGFRFVTHDLPSAEEWIFDSPPIPIVEAKSEPFSKIVKRLYDQEDIVLRHVEMAEKMWEKGTKEPVVVNVEYAPHKVQVCLPEGCVDGYVIVPKRK